MYQIKTLLSKTLCLNKNMYETVYFILVLGLKGGLYFDEMIGLDNWV
jgi:hypothetical protein